MSIEREMFRLEDLPEIDSELAERLKSAGLDHPLLLAVATAEHLEGCGLGRAEAIELMGKTREKLDIRFQTLREFADRIYQVSRISTGSRYLDDLMERGVETMKVTEFFGPAASGKTQLSQQLAVNVQLSEGEGGLGSEAVYIDTERGFSPRRIEEMARAKDLRPREVLRKIFYARADTVEGLFEMVRKAEKFLQDKSARIVIVDNLAGPFSAQFDRFRVHEKQVLTQKLLFRLLTYGEVYNAAVVFTNRVYSIPDAIAAESLHPFGGMVVDRSVHKKIMLRNQRQHRYLARDFRSDRETLFRIDEGGVSDL